MIAKKIKILHIITSLGQGGAQRVLNELTLSTLNIFDHHIFVLLNRGEEMKNKFNKKGIRIYQFNNKNLFEIFSSFKRLIFFTIKEKPNLIQTWLYHSDLVSCILGPFGIPILWNIRHSNSTKNTPKHRLITIKLCQFLSYFIPIKILSCSREGIKYHKNIGYADRFLYVPNGSSRNEKLLKSKQNIEQRNIYNIGFFHRFNYQKGIETFLGSLYYLKKKYKRDFKVIVGGKDMDLNNKYLINMISKLDLKENINLHGYLNNIDKYIIKCDFTVLASEEGEGCPNIILESMSYKVPVIATDCGDSKLLIGKAGYISPIKNKNILAKKMDLMIQNIEKNIPYKNMQNICEERWKKYYQKEIMIENYKNLWLNYVKR